jgi:CMP-2-keto-3-deoxyoctulosonic acid synthetase
LIPSENVIITDKAENGTARICSCFTDFFDYDYIINIQGDMLDITYETIEPIINNINSDRQLLTAYTKGYNPKGVKIIHQDGYACWFTRKDIGYGDKHLGIYAYPIMFLDRYRGLTENYPEEDLEQNRILGSFWKIKAIEVEYNGREINNKNDL